MQNHQTRGGGTKEGEFLVCGDLQRGDLFRRTQDRRAGAVETSSERNWERMVLRRRARLKQGEGLRRNEDLHVGNVGIQLGERSWQKGPDRVLFSSCRDLGWGEMHGAWARIQAVETEKQGRKGWGSVGGGGEGIEMVALGANGEGREKGEQMEETYGWGEGNRIEQKK